MQIVYKVLACWCLHLLCLLFSVTMCEMHWLAGACIFWLDFLNVLCLGCHSSYVFLCSTCFFSFGHLVLKFTFVLCLCRIFHVLALFSFDFIAFALLKKKHVYAIFWIGKFHLLYSKCGLFVAIVICWEIILLYIMVMVPTIDNQTLLLVNFVHVG